MLLQPIFFSKTSPKTSPKLSWFSPSAPASPGRFMIGPSCGWTTGAWSACGVNCGPQQREVGEEVCRIMKYWLSNMLRVYIYYNTYNIYIVFIYIYAGIVCVNTDIYIWHYIIHNYMWYICILCWWEFRHGFRRWPAVRRALERHPVLCGPVRWGWEVEVTMGSMKNVAFMGFQ